MTTPHSIAAALPRFAMDFDFLPPSVNHMYGVNRNGQRYITTEARDLKESMRLLAQLAGFRPDLKKRYALGLDFIMPHQDSLDIDSGLKSLIDAVFSSRTDQRIMELHAYKWVEARSTPQTLITIAELHGTRQRPAPSAELQIVR